MLLLSLILPAQSIPVEPLPGQQKRVGEMFTVDETCNGIDLDRYFDDLRTLLQSGLTAIRALYDADSFPLDSEVHNYMRNVTYMM